MKDFWESQIRKNFLFNEIYDIDSLILRFQNWFAIEYDINLKRSYCYHYQTGDNEFTEDCISEDEYLKNQENSNYITHINYKDIILREDYDKICKEFETLITDSFIYESQNIFLKFAQDSINQSQTDGQAKTLLKSILETLDTCSNKQTLLLGNGSLNRLQEIIVEAFSSSYWDIINMLVRRYDSIYDRIIKPYKEVNPEIPQAQTPKEEMHTQIFAGKAFYLWERMRKHFKLQDTSRADFKFTFEIMKSEGYIHKTVKQTDMLNWINDTYEINIGKPRYENYKKDFKRIATYNMLKSMYQELDT